MTFEPVSESYEHVYGCGNCASKFKCLQRDDVEGLDFPCPNANFLSDVKGVL